MLTVGRVSVSDAPPACGAAGTSANGARDEMMRAGFFFHDDAFSHAYPVQKGSYARLAYAWSANGAETGTLSVQGELRVLDEGF